MNYLVVITLITLMSCIVALPVTTGNDNKTSMQSATSLLSTASVVENDIFEQQQQQQQKEEEEEMKTTSFPVQVDRLAQLIATHLQFDHLDAVISRTDTEIATEFQHHIQINVEPNEKNNDDDNVLSHNNNNNNNNNKQHPIQLPTLDMMDLEMLKSQIFAAIQAHTEGNMPLTWDKLADKLSRQAIESHVRTSLLKACGVDDDQDLILSTCLKENAVQLAKEVDGYITSSLTEVFELLDQKALPDLLQHTAQDLKGILLYFNSAFLQDGKRKFILQVVPWNSDPTDIHNFKSRLLEIAVHPSLMDHGDIHSTAFFVEYADMARV